MSFRNGILAVVLLAGLVGMSGCAVPVNAEPYRRDWRRDDYDWRRNQAWRRQREWRREECYRHPWRC